jgi:hypothetical protein
VTSRWLALSSCRSSSWFPIARFSRARTTVRTVFLLSISTLLVSFFFRTRTQSPTQDRALVFSSAARFVLVSIFILPPSLFVFIACSRVKRCLLLISASARSSLVFCFDSIDYSSVRNPGSVLGQGHTIERQCPEFLLPPVCLLHSGFLSCTESIR